MRGLTAISDKDSETGQKCPARAPDDRLQIRSQRLREWEPAPDSDAVAAFTITPERPPAPAGEAGRTERTQSVSAWRADEVEHAIAAATRAGLTHFRIEIAPDGTISIVVGETPEG